MGITQIGGGTGSGSGSGSGKAYYATKFTSSGTFTLPAGYGASNPLTVEALLVGGGGGSGASTNLTAGGGGGGGGVKYDVCSLTSDTAIVVGRGGQGGVYAPNGYCGYGGNGQASVIGAAVKNMFINPQCIPLHSTGANWTFVNGNSPNFSFGNGGAISGTGIQVNVGTNTQLTMETQPYRVTAGATYTVSCYYQVTGVQNAPILTWSTAFWNLSGKNTNTLSVAGSSAINGSTSWARSSYTFTAPASADAVSIRLFFQNGATANTHYVSNFQLEVGSSATTYADGDTAGFAWTGPREGSETVASTALSAVAGGGGGGCMYEFTTSGKHSIGMLGATSGGAAISLTGTVQVMAGGHGGGAGGGATAPLTNVTGTSVITGPPSPGAPMGAGSIGTGFLSATTAVLIDRGNPGPGVDEGYGMGGYGATLSASSSTTNGYLGPWATYPSLLANTGAGGWANSGIANPSAPRFLGNPGADGLVILRYWA